MERQKPRRWTSEEDARLLRQIESFPQNLSRCFIIVAEELDRTPTSVSAHWYTVLSKKPGVCTLFTASAKHISVNRKNGMGKESTMGIWRRLLRAIRIFLE